MRVAVAFAGIVVCALAACSGDHAGAPDGPLTCGGVQDCPPNPGGACAQVCADGSNPCVYTCLDHACVPRGCPPADAGGAAVHAEGESCDDGNGCDPGLVCKAVGDPCPTYPKCDVCYRPCGDAGVCPSGYRACLPPSGQGGDVCIH